MIEFKVNEKELEIYLNGSLVINHSFENPFLLVGNGKEKIEAYRGNFDISDNITTKIPLMNFEVIDDVKIKFHYADYSIEATFELIDNRLYISFAPQGFETNRLWVNLYAAEDEKVYGGGEEASYFNLRGRNFPIWTSEPGVGRDKNSITKFYADKYDRAGGDYYNTYYPEPTFVSSRKYWCHADTYSYCELNFEREEYHSLYFWDVPSSIIIEYADSFLDVVERLTDFTGRLPELPEWLHDGIILGVQGGTEQALEYVDLAIKNGVKVNGVWCQDWVGTNITTFGKRLYWQWKWNEQYYPELDKKIVELKEKNISFLAYICPFLLEDEQLFSEAKESNFLALNKEGEVYIEDFGEFYCGLVDFTNPRAFDWYKNVIKTNLIDLGIRGWMADFGEYLPFDCVLHNGKDGKSMHNEWPVLWAKCNYEAVKESGKMSEIIYFMRAGAHGSQKYCLSLWAGDQSVNWEKHDGIPSVIPSALSTGIIGNPYTHSDIGGYTSLYGNIRTKELFERWCEMNVFSSYMRTHEGNRPDQNFQFYDDEMTIQHMAKMSEIRVALKPYIVDIVREGSQKGYPVQRPIFLHYEDDEMGYDIQDEFLFGKDIVVAPVLKPNVEEAEVYLPEDTWVHFWTGRIFKGGVAKVPCPVGYPPVFYRADSEYKKVFVRCANLNRI